MKRLAAFVISGYGQAVFCVVMFTGLAFVIPVASIFSGATLGLSVFRFGFQRTLFIIAAAALVLLGISLISAHFSTVSLYTGSVWGFVVVQWLPVAALAQLVRTTKSLSLLLQSCAVLAVLTVLGIFVFVPDSAAMWAEVLHWAIQDETSASFESSPELAEQYNNVLLELMTGFVVSAILLIWIVSVLLACWWQSLLIEPGSFKKSFVAIELSKVAAALGLAGLAIATLSENSTVIEIVIVLMTVFLFQGIAAAHFLLSRQNGRKVFLFLFYAAFVLLPVLPVLPSLVGIFGMLESFMNLRGRSGQPRITG